MPWTVDAYFAASLCFGRTTAMLDLRLPTYPGDTDPASASSVLWWLYGIGQEATDILEPRLEKGGLIVGA